MLEKFVQYIFYRCRLGTFNLRCSFTDTDICNSGAADEVHEETSFVGKTFSVPVVHLKSDSLEMEELNLLGSTYADNILTALPVSLVISHIALCQNKKSFYS